jgi:hypothetical protein
MSEYAGPSTTATLFRNDDPLSQVLREVATIDLDDIVRLNQNSFPLGDTLCSDTNSSTAIFSIREDSTITKPTSIDTYYGAKRLYKGKCKPKSSSTSSLSGNNGSASEAEVERRARRRNSLFAIRDWANQGIDRSLSITEGYDQGAWSDLW